MKLNLRYKKIIAREFLILITCLVIWGIAFISIYPYNHFQNNKVDSINESISKTKEVIDSLNKTTELKISKQKWFFNENKIRGGTGEFNTYSKLWDRITEIQKSDSIDYKWANIWSSDLVQMLIDIDLKTPKEFNDFILENSLDSTDFKNIQEVKKLNNEIIDLNANIKIINRRVVGPDQQTKYSFIVFLVLILVAFPLRLLVTTIRWSIQTLKQNE